ncbi:MAG: acyltransferase family protein [Acidimicrobiales bacterium]
MHAPPPPRWNRPRIDGLDGLRALAVVAVLLYHAEVPWAKGGFVGVDVFFVLSGYLVTSIVVAGFRRTGQLGLRRFWSARFRRLAPAQLALLVAVVVVAALFYSELLHDLRGQVVAALTGTTNWYLIATQASYFDQLGRPPLLRHLWSLAVELQFYLVFPPLLVWLLRRFGERLDRILLVLGGLVLASTIYLAVLFDPSTDPTRAYFDTFARLAAPLLGAMLALVWQPAALDRGPARRAGPLTSAVGAGSVVALLWIVHAAGDRSAVMYRGGFLVTALVSTVAVAAIVHPTGWIGSKRAFGHPLLVAIGLRSYGLYLWHWPIYMLLRPRIDVGWSWGVVFVVRIVLTVVATELCYRFIERPWHLRSPDASFAGIRRRLLAPRGVPTAPRLAALGGTFLVAVAAIVVVLPHEQRDATADSLEAGAAAIAASESRSTPSTTGSTRPGETTTTTLPELVEPGERTVTLIGDSVMVGAAPDVLSAFGDRANIDAEVSRQADALAPIITQLGKEGRLGQVVVAQVGINGTVTDEDLHAIEAAAGGRPLYIINARVPRSWEQSNNQLVAELVPKLEKGHVIDWYTASNDHRDWFLDDGIHLTPGGRVAYANLIRKAVDAG